MESISEFLDAHGYTTEDDCFVKGQGPGKITIQPSDYAGVTLAAFQKTAEKKGWLEQPNQTYFEALRELIFTMDVREAEERYLKIFDTFPDYRADSFVKFTNKMFVHIEECLRKVE